VAPGDIKNEYGTIEVNVPHRGILIVPDENDSKGKVFTDFDDDNYKLLRPCDGKVALTHKNARTKDKAVFKHSSKSGFKIIIVRKKKQYSPPIDV